jgi:ADP-ribosylglycohydrolase
VGLRECLSIIYAIFNINLSDPYRTYRCFLASPENFEQTLSTAVDAGHDADTVAAMACTVAGAYHGYAKLPRQLVADLEFHDRLVDLADGLYDLNRRRNGRVA